MDGHLEAVILTTSEEQRLTFYDPFGLATNVSQPTGSDVILSIADIYTIHRPSIAIVDRYVTPIWYAVGFPGNAITFFVWIQPGMRQSSGCYLAALAATDFFFLCLHLIFELQSAWDVTLLRVPVFCEVFPVFFLAAQYLSPLLVLGFTVERYVAVCHPFKRGRYCTTRRSLGVIAALAVLSVALHLVQSYFWVYDPRTLDCSVRPEITENGAASVWSVWSWCTELLVFGVVPVAILTLNVLVIIEARRISVNERRLLCRVIAVGPGQNPTSGSGGPSATTVMLLAVSFYLIVTTLPVTVSYAIFFTFPMGDIQLLDAGPEAVSRDVTWQRHFTYWTVRTVIQELSMSHFAGNFYIYLATGKIFRHELRKMVARWFPALVRGTRVEQSSFSSVKPVTIGNISPKQLNSTSLSSMRQNITEMTDFGFVSTLL